MAPSDSLRASFALIAAALLGGCSDPPAPAPTSFVPSDYARRFTEVRGCRVTQEHVGEGVDGGVVSNIRVWVNPESAAAYLANAATLPAGTLVIKEQFRDASCSRLSSWTVMRKEPGFDPAHGDWHWQRVRSSDNGVVEDGRVARCFSACHSEAHCVRRDWMCTEP